MSASRPSAGSSPDPTSPSSPTDSAASSTSSPTSSSTSRFVVLGLWVGAVITWLVVSRMRGVGPIDAAESLRELLADNWWGPALYILVYALRPIILFPASILTILGGLAFGPVVGIGATVVGSNLSTAATYVTARFIAGRRQFDPPIGKRALERLAANPFETTLILRLVAAPFDAVGLAAGVLGLRFWPFLAGSFLGTIAGTVAFVSFGASIDSLSDGTPGFDSTLLIISVALTVAGLVVARLLRRRRPDLATEPSAAEVPA